MLTLEGQDTSTLKQGQFFGYPEDSGTGCFVDAGAARELDRKMSAEEGYYEQLTGDMHCTYVHTWSWLNTAFGEGNLVAFSSGDGDGYYATYAGFEADREISVIVTDFSIVPREAK
jgi:hypothetical protein